MWWPEDWRKVPTGECVWSCADCGERCQRHERGHLDRHTHAKGSCPKTGAIDTRVTPIGDK